MRRSIRAPLSAEYKERSDFGQTDYDFNLELYRYGLKMMELDLSHADKDFESMIAFETKLADHSMSSEDISGADSTALKYNYYNIDEIKNWEKSDISFQRWKNIVKNPILIIRNLWQKIWEWN